MQNETPRTCDLFTSEGVIVSLRALVLCRCFLPPLRVSSVPPPRIIRKAQDPITRKSAQSESRRDVRPASETRSPPSPLLALRH